MRVSLAKPCRSNWPLADVPLLLVRPLSCPFMLALWPWRIDPFG